MKIAKFLNLLIWLNALSLAWTHPAFQVDNAAGGDVFDQTPAAPATPSRYVSATQGVPIEELLAKMLERNKELQAAREQLHQAEARLQQAQLRPNPSLDVGHTTDFPFAREAEGGYDFTFSQPIELGGKRAKRIRVAQISVDLAKAQIADTERQLAAQMRSVFGEALGAAAKLELLERTAELNQQMVHIMEVRLRSGDAARLDSTLLAATTNQLEAQRVEVENQLAGLVLQIETLAGTSLQEPLLLRGRLAIPAINITEEIAIQTALQNRPDFRAARLREEFAEAGIALAKAQAVPNLNPFVRYSTATDLIEGLLKPQERIVDRAKFLSFGVSVPLPLFNRGQGNIAESISERSQARALREALEQTVRRDVLLAYRRSKAARRGLDILRQRVLAPSEESTHIVHLAYRLGEMRLLDVVSQQRLFLDVQTSYATAQKDYYLALVDLERALGIKLEPPNQF